MKTLTESLKGFNFDKAYQDDRKAVISMLKQLFGKYAEFKDIDKTGIFYLKFDINTNEEDIAKSFGMPEEVLDMAEELLDDKDEFFTYEFKIDDIIEYYRANVANTVVDNIKKWFKAYI